ncbi:hypothetical protein NEOKW01_2032 [Nematocida sp. AWRm80]|nr:hypothetical protein NEOKW01_2032 [Nematocida sp. AWRm80]
MNTKLFSYSFLKKEETINQSSSQVPQSPEQEENTLFNTTNTDSIAIIPSASKIPHTNTNRYDIPDSMPITTPSTSYASDTIQLPQSSTYSVPAVNSSVYMSRQRDVPRDSIKYILHTSNSLSDHTPYSLSRSILYNTIISLIIILFWSYFLSYWIPSNSLIYWYITIISSISLILVTGIIYKIYTLYKYSSRIVKQEEVYSITNCIKKTLYFIRQSYLRSGHIVSIISLLSISICIYYMNVSLYNSGVSWIKSSLFNMCIRNKCNNSTVVNNIISNGNLSIPVEYFVDSYYITLVSVSVISIALSVYSWFLWMSSLDNNRIMAVFGIGYISAFVLFYVIPAFRLVAFGFGSPGSCIYSNRTGPSHYLNYTALFNTLREWIVSTGLLFLFSGYTLVLGMYIYSITINTSYGMILEWIYNWCGYEPGVRRCSWVYILIDLLLIFCVVIILQLILLFGYYLIIPPILTCLVDFSFVGGI